MEKRIPKGSQRLRWEPESGPVTGFNQVFRVTRKVLLRVASAWGRLSLDTNIAIFLRYLEVFEKFRKKSDI